MVVEEELDGVDVLLCDAIGVEFHGGHELAHEVGAEIAVAFGVDVAQKLSDGAGFDAAVEL